MKNPKLNTSFEALEIDWIDYLDKLDDKQKCLYSKLEQIGQLSILNQIPFSLEDAQYLTLDLQEIDDFYQDIGGIVGYQKALEQTIFPEPFDKTILEAPYTKISGSLSDYKISVEACIKNLPQLAEVYAVGGAADRLNLKAGEQLLPAACLKIANKTLLEYLIHDVEAKEWLFYKFFNQTITVPIVMMTSFEKNNQEHIFQILEQHEFFQRDQQSFYIFHQPLVPMVDHHLNWQTQKNGLFLKPGGHGAIWGLCQKHQIFDKLFDKGIRKLSIRQINNPIAAIDFGHFSFLGIGFLKNAHFGFYACERYAGSQEGINVLLRNKNQKYSLTNIEYCQLQSCGIEDRPDAKGLSQYPANTNVLFADLEMLKNLTSHHHFPGKILNFKSFTWEGKTKDLARLETMMQNMADYLEEPHVPLEKVYMTLSERIKTISPVKKQKQVGGSFSETPQACFYDFIKNAKDLLTACQIDHPNLSLIEDYYQNPSWVVTYLPALGPLFDIIKQKWKGGSIYKKSFLDLQIAEVFIQDLVVNGAFLIKAKNPYGYHNTVRQFSEACARVHLVNCQIKNKGVDWENSVHFYQDYPHFLESMEIVLEGFSEFKAENIQFHGTYKFHVPDGYKMIVQQDQSMKLQIQLFKIEKPTWLYEYVWQQDCLCLVQRQSS